MLVEAKPAWTDADRKHVIDSLWSKMGALYMLGAKWPDGELDTKSKPVDCSGLVRWAFSLRGVILPHGSYNQFPATAPWPGQFPAPLCLGFADLHPPSGVADHVIIAINDTRVIEARAPSPYGVVKGGRVMTRPIANWSVQKGFLGWRYVPGAVEVG